MIVMHEPVSRENLLHSWSAWKSALLVQPNSNIIIMLVCRQEAKIDETKRHVMVILDLVTWMCDGQKMENQDLFREQESQFNVRKGRSYLQWYVGIVLGWSIFIWSIVYSLAAHNSTPSYTIYEFVTEYC